MGLRRRLLVWLGLGCAACTPPRPPAVPGVERVVFVGDSLVNRSEEEHGLLARVGGLLERLHPDRRFELLNAGVNGDTIAGIRARLQHDVIDLAPSAVVLYWDSDAADVEDSEESPERAAELRVDYERHLAAVLDLLRSATPHVIVAGPTLYGERPRGQNPKDRVLDSYAEINRRISHLHRATWVDTRRAAFTALERDPALRLTEDGEHLSAEGTMLLGDELAAALARQLGRRPGPAEPGQAVE